jgi:hypothetical protein
MGIIASLFLSAFLSFLIFFPCFTSFLSATFLVSFFLFLSSYNFLFFLSSFEFIYLSVFTFLSYYLPLSPVFLPLYSSYLLILSFLFLFCISFFLLHSLSLFLTLLATYHYSNFITWLVIRLVFTGRLFHAIFLGHRVGNSDWRSETPRLQRTCCGQRVHLSGLYNYSRPSLRRASN